MTTPDWRQSEGRIVRLDVESRMSRSQFTSSRVIRHATIRKILTCCPTRGKEHGSSSSIFLDLVPAKRLGMPDEVGKLVVFLCSDDAAYITGAIHTIAPR